MELISLLNSSLTMIQFETNDRLFVIAQSNRNICQKLYTDNLV